MVFNGEIIKEKSMDPYFRIKFSYEEKDFVIKYGIAEVVRKAPITQISYDPKTEAITRGKDKSKLELELLNIVIGYLLSKGISKTYRGKVILSA